MKKSIQAGLCVSIVSLCIAPIAGAATFNVSTYADISDPTPDGTCDSCSLREAIQEANALPGPDVINLPPGKYNLDIAGSDEDQGLTGDLDITDDVTIIGIGTTSIESHVGRILHVHSGNVSITGLTLTQGDGANDQNSNQCRGKHADPEPVHHVDQPGARGRRGDLQRGHIVAQRLHPDEQLGGGDQPGRRGL